MFGNRLRSLLGGKAAERPAPQPQAAPAAELIEEAVAAQDDGLIAAIAAAVASVWTGPQGFVVRRIRRIPRPRGRR